MGDLQNVMKHIESLGLFSFESVTETSLGIAQARFIGGGNVQLFLTKHGQATGNARICIGSLAKLKDLRSAILRSHWFSDAIGGRNTHDGAASVAVHQPWGLTLLPPLTLDFPMERLKPLLQMVWEKLGPTGRKAMRHYVRARGVGKEPEAMKLVNNVFDEEPKEAKTSKKKTKKEDI